MVRLLAIAAFLALVLTSSSLFGRDAAQLSSEQIIALARLDVQEGVPEDFENLGPVQGVSCSRPGYFASVATVEEATQNMKISTVREKPSANAVVAATCNFQNKVDWGRNCTSTIVCVGVAAKIDYSKQ